MIADHEARLLATNLLDVPAEQVVLNIYEGHWMATIVGPNGERLAGGTAAVIAPDGDAWLTSSSMPPRLRLRRPAGD